MCGVTTPTGLRYGLTGESIIQVFGKTLLLNDPTGQMRWSRQKEVERFEIAIMIIGLIQRLPRWFNKLLIRLAFAIYISTSILFHVSMDLVGRGASTQYTSMVFMSTIGRRMTLTSRYFV
jgi:hypothetical protein